jgi:hypothetical protein
LEGRHYLLLRSVRGVRDGRQEIKRGPYGIRSVDAGEKVVGGKEAVVLWSETADHVILG